MRSLPRSALALASASLILAGGFITPVVANATTSPTPTPSTLTSATPTPTPTVIASVPGAPTITSITGGIIGGQLVVAYTPPSTDGGSLIVSYQVSVNAGTDWWTCTDVHGTCTLTNLVNGQTYTIWIRAVNAVGPGPSSVPASGVPSIPPGADPAKPITLPKPRVWTNATFNAASNNLGVDGGTTRLGVGTLPSVTFTRSIPDKSVVETHLAVTAELPDGTVKKVKGAWGWMSDRRAIFRPAKWWPAHSTISVASTLDRAVMGKAGKKWVIGSNDLDETWTFETARKLVATVDGSTDRMKVYVDGKKVKDFGVSLGKADWETRGGVKVISTQKEPTHTYTSTALNLDPSVEQPYELKDIPWNTRLTPTGEFIHSAPWAYGRIGRYNGSHGCTNMFESDAKWIYDKTIPGDVVIYSKTGGAVVPSWNGPGGLWNIPWDQWLKKSALGSPDGKPDTSDATSSAGATVTSASA